jgi:pyruvate/2-oxoglutarate/acetoin dehydrogenase E1 component
VGAEILASVASEGIQLQLPPRRIAVPFMPIPALKALERAYLPTVESVTAAAVQMCNAQS